MRVLLMLVGLLQGSDDEAKRIAALEAKGPIDTAVAKVALGDEWVGAAHKFPKEKEKFLQNGFGWYGKAWPDLEVGVKMKLRERLHKIVGFPQDWAKRGKLTERAVGWDGFGDYWGASIETTFGHSGKACLKIISTGKGNETGNSGAHTASYVASPGKKYVLSAWVFTELNENGGVLDLRFIDKAGKYIEGRRVPIPEDNPWWQKIEGEVEAPAEAVRLDVNVSVYVKNGVVFVDDLSVLIDSKQVLKNGSLEEK